MSDEELKKVANEVRKGIVTGVHAAKSGHPGGSLGAADIMTYLYFEEMNVDPADPRKADRDRFVLSKGHCAPGLYAVLAERGFFPKEDLKTLRHIGSHLQGHPNMNDTPGVDMSTGSLGQGISAAVGMDKKIMKDVFRAHDIPVMEGKCFYRRQWREEKDNVKKAIEALGYPVFVKPVNLGSSIGITKVKEAAELDDAMDLAASYDRKILVEKAAENPREINCAVMGYAGDVIASALEEPVGWKDLLSFDDKYVGGGKKSGPSKGKNARNCPADVDEDLKKKIEDLAKSAFTAIDACGAARIDFLVTEAGPVVNEINTLPGSMGFYLWEPVGIPFAELLNRVIELGEIRAKERKDTTYSYESNLFTKTTYGSKL